MIGGIGKSPLNLKVSPLKQDGHKSSSKTTITPMSSEEFENWRNLVRTKHEESESIDLENIFVRQLFNESRFKSDAVSPKGAISIAQVMPSTFEYGLKKGWVPKGTEFQDLAKDDKLAMQFHEEYMNDLLDRSWNQKGSKQVKIAKALAAYNMGPTGFVNYLNKQKEKGVDIYQTLDWVNELNTETKNYVNNILLGGDEEYESEFERVYSEWEGNPENQLAVEKSPLESPLKQAVITSPLIAPIIAPVVDPLPQDLYTEEHIGPDTAEILTMIQNSLNEKQWHSFEKEYKLSGSPSLTFRYDEDLETTRKLGAGVDDIISAVSFGTIDTNLEDLSDPHWHHYNMYTNTIHMDPDGFYNPGTGEKDATYMDGKHTLVNVVIAELGHARIQHMLEGEGEGIGADIRKWIAKRGVEGKTLSDMIMSSVSGSDQYHTPGMMEHFIHETVEPYIEQRIFGDWQWNSGSQQYLSPQAVIDMGYDNYYQMLGDPDKSRTTVKQALSVRNPIGYVGDTYFADGKKYEKKEDGWYLFTGNVKVDGISGETIKTQISDGVVSTELQSSWTKVNQEDFYRDVLDVPLNQVNAWESYLKDPYTIPANENPDFITNPWDMSSEDLIKIISKSGDYLTSLGIVEKNGTIKKSKGKHSISDPTFTQASLLNIFKGLTPEQKMEQTLGSLVLDESMYISKIPKPIFKDGKIVGPNLLINQSPMFGKFGEGYLRGVLEETKGEEGKSGYEYMKPTYGPGVI
mgnify:CR=1 FL=1|tara:strand:+ start:159 stop:2390 length:2232 start_codon:yes stop_codon:yes gene_type:complete